MTTLFCKGKLHCPAPTLLTPRLKCQTQFAVVGLSLDSLLSRGTESRPGAPGPRGRAVSRVDSRPACALGCGSCENKPQNLEKSWLQLGSCGPAWPKCRDLELLVQWDGDHIGVRGQTTERNGTLGGLHAWLVLYAILMQ